MFFAKGVPAVPLLDWLAVIFVEIEALFLRDVETLKDSFVKSEVLVLMGMEVVGEVFIETFMNAEAGTLGMKAVEILGDALVEPEAVLLTDMETLGSTLELLLWLTAGQSREFRIELNVEIIQVQYYQIKGSTFTYIIKGNGAFSQSRIDR